MDEDFVRQLNLRIEENQRYLRERLDDLSDAIRTIHGALTDRLDAHEAYHQANEHCWGLGLLAHRHPFRLALAAMIGGWLFMSALPETLALIQVVMHHLIQLFAGK